MKVNKQNSLAPYTAPSCRTGEVVYDRSFLASGDFGEGGYPGKDLEPGDEWEL
jgi:hypothetical protein